MKVEDCIKRFDDLVLPAWCKLYIDFINNQNRKPLLVASGLEKDIRNVEGVTFSFDLMHEINKLPKEEKIKHVPIVLMFHSILKQLEIPLLNYQTMFPGLYSLNLLQIDFLKYEKDGKYEVHTDQGPDAKQRLLTAIINLNHDYEGGEFEFYSVNKKDVIRKENLKEGSVLLFPSNFCYPHSVKTITSGERYSLVCWLG